MIPKELQEIWPTLNGIPNRDLPYIIKVGDKFYIPCLERMTGTLEDMEVVVLVAEEILPIEQVDEEWHTKLEK